MFESPATPIAPGEARLTLEQIAVRPPPVGGAETARLYEKYSGRIQWYCQRWLRSREDAEDAAQTTFLLVHRAMQKGVVPRFEAGWLYKIAHNVCVAQLRCGRRAWAQSAEHLQELEQQLAGRGSDRHEELIGLRDALAAMPENLRRPLLLREWQGLSYAEIAEALEISPPAVGTMIFRARRQLAQALENGAKKPLRRVAQALNLGPLLAAGRSLLAGAGGAKLAATGLGVLAAGLGGGGYAVSVALSQHGSPSTSELRARSALAGTPGPGLGQPANAKLFSPASQFGPRVSSRNQLSQVPEAAAGSAATGGGATSAGDVPTGQLTTTHASGFGGADLAPVTGSSSAPDSVGAESASNLQLTTTSVASTSSTVMLPPAPTVRGILRPPSVSTSSPVTSVSATAPSTSVSATMPAATVSATIPSTTVSASVPSTTVSATIPPLNVSASVPSMTVSATLAAATVSATLPASTVSATSTTPAAGIPDASLPGVTAATTPILP